jgi:hypothetical protein
MTGGVIHLRKPTAVETVCGIRTKDRVMDVESLLASVDPCPRCLEWVIEQGQIAHQRLESINEEGASQ